MDNTLNTEEPFHCDGIHHDYSVPWHKGYCWGAACADPDCDAVMID